MFVTAGLVPAGHTRRSCLWPTVPSLWVAETIPDITQHEDPRRWLSAVIYPLKEADGLVREVVLIHEDITARKRAEDARLGSEQRFRQLADAMPQIVWTARPDGEIYYLNRRWYEFTGLPESQGNEGWGHILHPDDAPAANERHPLH